MTGPPVIPLTVTFLLTLIGTPQSPANVLLPEPYISPDITDLCPFSSFCTHTSNQSIPDPTLQSCCLPCSCDPGCGSVNKCCPDVQNAVVPAKVYPCRYVSEIISYYLNNPAWKGDDQHSYIVIDECPKEAYTSPELYDSLNRCYTATDVQDLVFVTGSVSGRTYLNKRCAMCNYEFDYMEWGVYAVHGDLIEGVTSFKERDRRIFETGDIRLVPPSREIALGTICSTRQINTCNATGKWDYYDKKIEIKCKGMTMDYYTTGWGILKSYANVYCFLCNNPKGTPVPSTCERIKVASMREKNVWTSFTALVMLASNAPPLDTGPICAEADILDPFRMECTELLCPIGSFAQNGDCVPFVDDPFGLQVDVPLIVKFDNTITDFDELIRDLTQLVMRQVNTAKTKCGLCGSIMFFNKKTRHVEVIISLFTTYRCSVSELLTGLFRIFTSTIVQVTLPRANKTVTLTKLEGDRSKIDMLARTGRHACYNAVMQFFTEEAIHCPSILLNRNVSGFVTNERAASEIMSSVVEVGNDTVRVCVNTYMSVFRNTQANAGKMSQSDLIVALIMSVLVALPNV